MTSKPAVVVLDTNVLLDLFIFEDRQVMFLLPLIQSGQMTLLIDTPCLMEALEVFQRPAIVARSNEASEAPARLKKLATSEGVHGRPTPLLPQCRDTTDQKFIELAARNAPAFLITRDRALLTLARRVAVHAAVRIVDPHDARDALADLGKSQT